MRASQRHKRAIVGMDSAGKGIGVSKEAGTAASPATAFTGGIFLDEDTVELGILLNGGATQIDTVYTASGTMTADEMATGLAAGLNAIVDVTATALGEVITITPSVTVNLVDPRSRRK